MSDRSETLGVPGTLEGVGQAIEAFGRFAREVDLPDAVRRDVQMALDEVLSNVVRHGLAGAGALEVGWGLAGGRVTAEVVDGGPPFNPLSAPAPDTSAPLDRRRPGGLGIALVATIMDDVRYERLGGRNHLRMERRIAT
jgi:serine/threonine-protein kinase RsbW